MRDFADLPNRQTQTKLESKQIAKKLTKCVSSRNLLGSAAMAKSKAPKEEKKQSLGWALTPSVAIVVLSYWFMNGNPTQQVGKVRKIEMPMHRGLPSKI